MRKLLHFVLDGCSVKEPEVLVRIPKPGRPPITGRARQLKVHPIGDGRWFGNMRVPEDVMFVLYEYCGGRNEGPNMMYMDQSYIIRIHSAPVPSHEYEGIASKDYRAPQTHPAAILAAAGIPVPTARPDTRSPNQRLADGLARLGVDAETIQTVLATQRAIRGRKAGVLATLDAPCRPIPELVEPELFVRVREEMEAQKAAAAAQNKDACKDKASCVHQPYPQRLKAQLIAAKNTMVLRIHTTIRDVTSRLMHF